MFLLINLMMKHFFALLAEKFEIRPSKFSQYVLKWRENEFKEVPGRNKIPIEIQNKICNFLFFFYRFTQLKQKKCNHQVRKYHCTWDPSKKGLKKEQRMIISENIS